MQSERPCIGAACVLSNPLVAIMTEPKQFTTSSFLQHTGNFTPLKGIMCGTIVAEETNRSTTGNNTLEFPPTAPTARPRSPHGTMQSIFECHCTHGPARADWSRLVSHMQAPCFRERWLIPATLDPVQFFGEKPSAGYANFLRVCLQAKQVWDSLTRPLLSGGGISQAAGPALQSDGPSMTGHALDEEPQQEEEVEATHPEYIRTATLRSSNTLTVQGASRGAHRWRSLSPKRRVRSWECSKCLRLAWGPGKRQAYDTIGCTHAPMDRSAKVRDTLLTRIIWTTSTRRLLASPPERVGMHHWVLHSIQPDTVLACCLCGRSSKQRWFYQLRDTDCAGIGYKKRQKDLARHLQAWAPMSREPDEVAPPLH
eukprot:6492558-Amphidinium_carterae.4